MDLCAADGCAVLLIGAGALAILMGTVLTALM